MKPLVVFHHIPKNAGTSLRQLAWANHSAEEVLDLDKLTPVGDTEAYTEERWAAERSRWRERGRALDSEESDVTCAIGHFAPFLIPAVRERPAKAFCMLRDPVDRVISEYLFTVWRKDRLGSRGPEVAMLEAMRERGWQLKDVYRELGDAEDPSSELHRRFLPLFNGQTRHLLLERMKLTEIPFAAGVDELAQPREAASSLLADAYVVGTQDRFSQSVRLFADSFGWRRLFLPRVNAGRLREEEAAVDEETRSLIRRYNAVDGELHARYRDLLAGLPPVRGLTDAYWRARRRAATLRRRVAARG